MVLKLNCFCLITIIILSLFRGALSVKKGSYTIVTPGTIQPKSMFHVSLTSNDYHTSCWFNLSLSSFFNEKKFHEFETIEVQPKSTKLVELLAPPFNSTLANIEVLGNCDGIISKDTAVIHFEYEKYWTFIQTNKLKYKPGELVQFRVICIDQLTRPAKDNQKINIRIYDDQFNLVKEFVDMKLVQGVFRGEMQLANSPVLGLWKIKVLSNGVLTDKTFEVDKYLVPKFNVEINTKKVYSIDDRQIALEIRASSFHGDPVKGNLSVFISNTDLPWNKWVLTPPSLMLESHINGETTIFIDLRKDLHLERENKEQKPLVAFSAPITPYQFHIEASVIDDINGEQSWTTTEIEVNSQPFKIDFQAPNEFDSDEILNIKIKVGITDFQNNPIIQEIKTPIEIIVGCYEKIGRYICSYADFDEFRIEYKNEIGKNFSIINVINKNYTECYLYAQYKGIKSDTERMYKKEKVFEINILTESPEEGKELAIEIKNPDPFEEFSYEIVSRRDIIQSGRVYVPGNQTTYILRLNMTFLMVPKITIYAHHVKNMSFGGQLKDVIIKRALQNSIDINIVSETSPDSPVEINVTTKEGSYVGLIGQDQRNLHNIDENDIFNEDYVNAKLESVNSIRSYAIPFYGRTANIITFSNVFPPGIENGPIGDLPIFISPKRIEKSFPENWLFNDFESTPAEGLNLFENAPHTITNWTVTGFSLHPEAGLTFTKQTSNLKVIQEFFVTIDLPNSVKEGEIIEVPICIGNYMNQNIITNVTIETDSKDLAVLEHPGDIFEYKQIINKIILRKTKEKIIIFIRPLKQGNYNVTVKAISSVANGAIQKTINVQPKGLHHAISKTYLVHLSDDGIQEDEIIIDIPENAVFESQRVEVSVVGDVFRLLINNLQKISEVPLGRSEDNMNRIALNTIILKYLKVLNCSDPNLENKIKLNLELDYQNQLSFKYLDGSFGLFERKSERTGDIWQTIFTLWGLKQANEFISVDSNVVLKALQYLKSKLHANGCYKSESGIEEDAKLTAFGMMVFLMDENSGTNHNAVTTKGLDCLNDSTDNLEYSPIASLAAYVLLLGKHETTGDFLRKSNASLTIKQMVWAKSDALLSHIEATVASLMNLLESQKIPQTGFIETIRGLSTSKREESYAFSIIALHAMLPFVEELFIDKTNLKIRFKDDKTKSGDIRINDENSKILQTFELSSNSQKVKLHSRGHGFAMVDLKYEYNLVLENRTSSLYSTNVSIEKHSNFLNYLTICSKILTDKNQNKFTVIEVNLQSGYVFSEGDFNDIEYQSKNIKSIQYSDSRSKGVIYIEYDPSNETCIEMEVRRCYKIFNSKPGWVIAYGSQDGDPETTTSFQINES